MGAVAAAGALIAWLGGTLLVLSEARRGLALGLLTLATGLGLCLLVQASLEAAAVMLAGGLAAGALRLRDGAPGWGVMPPGATPRVLLCVVLGLLAVWLGLTVLSGPGGSTRVAVLSALGLAGGRVLSTEDRPGALAAAAALALALGGLGAFAAPPLQLVTAAAGSLIACLLALLPADSHQLELRETEGGPSEV